MEREYHPASKIFPLLGNDALNELAADIRQHGLRVSIVLDPKGRIIDGRNREAACQIAGVNPRYETCQEENPQKIVELVWSLNERRRHLKPEQRNAAALNMQEYLNEVEKAAKQRQRDAGQHGKKGGRPKKDGQKPLASVEAKGYHESQDEPKETSQTKKGGVTAVQRQPKQEKPLPSVEGKGYREFQNEPSHSANSSKRHKQETAAKVSSTTNTSRASIERTQAVKANAPDLFEKMQAGEVTTNAAYNQMRQRQKQEDLERKAEDARQLLEGQPTWLLLHNEVLDGLGHIADSPDRPNLIFADPPYNIGIDYGNGEKADRLPDSQYMMWVAEWIETCVQLLDPAGSMWVMIGDEYAAEYAMRLKASGLTIRSWIKWYETFGVNCAQNFNRTSRHLFYCVRDPKRFTFHSGAVMRPSDRQTKYNDKRAASGGKLWDDVWTIPRLTGTCQERVPNVPTQLPLDLLRAVVGCSSNPGDVVLDPFNGSGTTGVACVELGRRYIGVEQHKPFINVAEQRLLRCAGEIH